MRNQIGPLAILAAMLALVLGADGRATLPGAVSARDLQPAAAEPGTAPPLPAADTTKLVPLTELGAYKGFQGGLYPEGRDEPPLEHALGGLEEARRIQPLGLAGTPEPDGKIVLLSIGMSNTTQEFQAFQRLAAADPDVNPAVALVDGAQGGMTAARIRDPYDNGPGSDFWNTVDSRLQRVGLSGAQVQAVWLKEANARPTEPFPRHARVLKEQLGEVVRLLRTHFPRLRIVYLSSRIYGGYATTPLNPEPYAYESGFAVKWLIEDQIEGRGALNYQQPYGPVQAPWLAWGPYLWANGTKPRADGLTWVREDFAADGTHPSPQGQEKVARLLLDFLKTDPTARIWFTRGGG